MEKLLTVSVPAYNVEKYLDRCLGSLTSIQNKELLEVLVIDDGSTDGTFEKASACEKENPGCVRVIRKENGGHGSALNRAIEEATGKYFRNVDADDYVDSDGFERFLLLLRDEKRPFDVSLCSYADVDMESGKQTPVAQGSMLVPGNIYPLAEASELGMFYRIHAVTFRTEILKALPEKIQHNTFYVDVEFLCLPLPYVENVLISGCDVVRYMTGNPEQSMDFTNFINRFDHHDRVVKHLLEYEKKAPLNEDQKAFYEKMMWWLVNTHYNLMVLHDKDRARGYERMRGFDVYLSEVRHDLYESCGKRPRIALARKSGYSADSLKVKLTEKALSVGESITDAGG